MERADGQDVVLREALAPNLSLQNSSWDPLWNTMSNGTSWESSDSPTTLVSMVFKSILLGLIILLTIGGNSFVILTFLLQRSVRNAANIFIASLALTDLLVACCVMPLGAIYEIVDSWPFSVGLCMAWTFGDVLLCTGSILHLVAIAIDRYRAVTSVEYIQTRNSTQICYNILCVWTLSFLISIAPFLLFMDSDWDRLVLEDGRCLVNENFVYQIFATVFYFYLPVLVILILYWNIYLITKNKIQRRREASASCGLGLTHQAPMSTTGQQVVAGGSGDTTARIVTVVGRPVPTVSESTTTDPAITGCAGKPKPAAMSNRRTKPPKTIAVITITLVVCWLPFFILTLFEALSKYKVSPILKLAAIWLGYVNSALNPVIYTVFSPEFRRAFSRMLCGSRLRNRRADRYRRPRPTSSLQCPPYATDQV